jgi:hypothetical protein
MSRRIVRFILERIYCRCRWRWFRDVHRAGVLGVLA